MLHGEPPEAGKSGKEKSGLNGGRPHEKQEFGCRNWVSCPGLRTQGRICGLQYTALNVCLNNMEIRIWISFFYQYPQGFTKYVHAVAFF